MKDGYVFKRRGQRLGNEDSPHGLGNGWGQNCRMYQKTASRVADAFELSVESAVPLL